MSASLHIIGFRPPDLTWRLMKDVWDACRSAGVAIPTEVDAFFEYKDPDAAGVEVSIPLAEYADSTSNGYEILISTLPKDLTRIRVYYA